MNKFWYIYDAHKTFVPTESTGIGKSREAFSYSFLCLSFFVGQQRRNQVGSRFFGLLLPRGIGVMPSFLMRRS